MHLFTLTPPQRESLYREVMELFRLFCLQEFQTLLYPYQMRVASAILHSLLVDRKDVFVKLPRQTGKTEIVTLVLKFLMVFLLHLLGQPLMSAIASPNGEQAKTDVDRLKKSILHLKNRYGLEDRENNTQTIRAYRNDVLHAEMFKFSLAPTTSNESKTLNLLVIEEAHKINDQKRRDELDSMLVSTNGFTVFIGVGCTRLCDFKRGCDGHLPGVAVVVSPEEVIRDRRAMYEQTGDPIHLNYEHKFTSDLAKYGRNNPEIRRNYFLEDTVEEGNFIARSRLLTCARPAGTLIAVDKLFVGIDWARRSDHTWLTLVNVKNDVVDWFKYPHVTYPEQVAMMKADLEAPRKRLVPDGLGGSREDTFTYLSRVLGGRGDATGGAGDAPNEILQLESGLPVGEDWFFTFTTQSKNDLYVEFENALFKDEGDALRLSYPADHALAAEFEDQMTALVREYLREGEYLSVHHPVEPGALDDAPDSTALAVFAASKGFAGEIMFV